LHRAIFADRAGLGAEMGYGHRATVEDVARDIDFAYRHAVDSVERLHKQQGRAEESLDRAQRALQGAREAGNRRWEEMGRGLGLRQLGHFLRIKRDRYLDREERAEIEALGKIEKLCGELAGIGEKLGAAVKARDEAYERVRPQAERELAQRQERASLAHEVWTERQTQAREAARLREIEREKEEQRIQQKLEQGLELTRKERQILLDREDQGLGLER
jgi:hypothetical protein